MIERGEHLRFAMKARQAISIRGERGRKYRRRNVTIELGVTCAIHLAHTAGANGGDDFVRPEANAGTERHVSLWRGLYAAGGVDKIAVRLIASCGRTCVLGYGNPRFSSEIRAACCSLEGMAERRIRPLMDRQRAMFGEKLLELANYAVAALIFGQLVGAQRISLAVMFMGGAGYIALVLLAWRLTGDR